VRPAARQCEVRLAGLVWLVLGGPALAQQSCDTQSYTLSSPTSRFADNADGTATDTVSNLMWMRCSAGQSWTGQACSGAPSRLDWRAAQSLVQSMNQRGTLFFNDWRLPLLRELATIAERQCQNPRVNLAVFPDTPAAFYWTASSRSGPQSEGFAFALSFGAEGARFLDKDEPGLVRLVRNAR
jgi:hypothetical protein